MRKRIKYMVLTYAMVLATECVLFFVIPFSKTVAAWTEFAFTIIAICGGCGISWHAFKTEDLKRKIYGFPLFKIGFAYTAVQLFAGWIIVIIGSFVNVPMFISLVISILILAIAAIGTIGTSNVRGIITEQQDQARESVKQMKTFRLDLQSIVDICADKELKKRLEKLADDFRYSDPVSNDELSEIENNLQCEVKNLAALVNSDLDLAQKKVDKVSVLLANRNRRCKELKS